MSTTSTSGRHWFKSSYSRESSNCVVVSLGWQKPSLSQQTSTHAADTVLIRDDKYNGDPAAEPILAIPADVWPDFLAAVAAHHNTNEAVPGMPAIIRHADSTTTLRDQHDQVLVFTPGEWDAFTKGVLAGEFAPAA